MTIDASRLQVSVEEQPRWRRRMSVTVPASVVQEEEQKAARNVASRMKLKGFRKGKVPSKVVESRYGAALRQEALDRIIQDAYKQALAAENLRPISEGEVEDLVYQPEAGSDLVFSIAFDVQPQIELGRLGGFAVERPAAAVQDEHVDQMIEQLRHQQGAWAPADEGAPGDEDLVSVRIRRLDDEDSGEGKEYEFVLGQGDAIPDVEGAIKSLAVGASGEFTVTFPDDFPAEERRGEQERVEVAVLGRKILELPEVTDDFARQVGDFEDLQALRARVREDLQRDADRQAEEAVRSRLLDQLVEANPFEIPASMVERYTDSVLGEQTNVEPERLEEIKAQVRPEAERAVKRILLVERVAETQGLQATEDDVDARVSEIAEKNDTTPAEVYANLQKAGRLEQLERELTETRVFDFLKEQSEIIDAQG